jgi:hypothetical protein
MAQHISIKNSDKKELQKIYESICKSFGKGILSIQSSLKFQEIVDENFKHSENEKIFVTWRILRNEKETFEIHFNSEKNKITEIYLVK